MGLMATEGGTQQDLTGWMLVSVLVTNIAFNFINVTYHFLVDVRVKVRRVIKYIKKRRAVQTRPQEGAIKTEEAMMGVPTARNVS